MKIIIPSIPKIIMYLGFFFVSPTFFKVCNAECSYSFQFLSGWKLMQGTAPTLTFPMLVLLFIISYAIPCILIWGFTNLKERKMMLTS